MESVAHCCAYIHYQRGRNPGVLEGNGRDVKLGGGGRGAIKYKKKVVGKDRIYAHS